jgi:predicted transcriptional regulator
LIPIFSGFDAFPIVGAYVTKFCVSEHALPDLILFLRVAFKNIASFGGHHYNDTVSNARETVSSERGWKGYS